MCRLSIIKSVTHAACSACEQIARPALVGIGKVNTYNVVARLFGQFKAGLHGFVMLCFFLLSVQRETYFGYGAPEWLSSSTSVTTWFLEHNTFGYVP